MGEYLSWGDLHSSIEKLPENALKDPFFKKHQALALDKQGFLSGIEKGFFMQSDLVDLECGCLRHAQLW